MAITSRRVIVVWYIWRILWEWIVDVGIYRHTIAQDLPITWHSDSCPLRIVVLQTPETLGTLSRALRPAELPLATNIDHILRHATLRCSLD
jgi:hypothetical protein